MKKFTKIILVSVIFIIFICFINFILIPKIKYKQDYNPISNLSDYETIEEFFECLSDKNPGAANKYLLSPNLDEYCCNKVTTISLKKVEKVERIDINLQNYYDASEFFVTYDCNYFLGMRKNQIFSGTSSCTNIYLVKLSKDSDWRIYGWGLG